MLSSLPLRLSLLTHSKAQASSRHLGSGEAIVVCFFCSMNVVFRPVGRRGGPRGKVTLPSSSILSVSFRDFAWTPFLGNVGYLSVARCLTSLFNPFELASEKVLRDYLIVIKKLL